MYHLVALDAGRSALFPLSLLPDAECPLSWEDLLQCAFPAMLVLTPLKYESK